MQVVFRCCDTTEERVKWKIAGAEYWMGILHQDDEYCVNMAKDFLHCLDDRKHSLLQDEWQIIGSPS